MGSRAPKTPGPRRRRALPELEELRRSYASELPAKLRDVEKAARRLEQGDADALESLFHHVHRLAGSSAIHRFPAVSDAARVFEDLLMSLRNDPASAAGGRQAEIRPLLRGLREALVRDGLDEWRPGSR